MLKRLASFVKRPCKVTNPARDLTLRRNDRWPIK